ncbi:hypothetical protein D3C77_287010 [compost metagenome]
MYGGDLQLGQIEALAKHVDTDNDPVFFLDDLIQNPGLVRNIAVDQDWRQVSMLLVDLK